MSEDSEQPGSEPGLEAPASESVPAEEQTLPSVTPPVEQPGYAAPSTSPSTSPLPPPVDPPPPPWAPPAEADAGEPPAPVTPVPVPFSYPPLTDPTTPNTGGPPPSAPTGRGRVRLWLPVALVAALIGGAVGAGVTALADDSGNTGTSAGNVTIHESNAAPGAAVLSGNVTIPQLVNKVVHAVVSIDVKSNGNEDQGTGMIITSDGEVITNNHVIELYTQGGNSGAITVTEYGQTKALPTTLIGYDALEGRGAAEDQQRVQPADGHVRRLLQGGGG